eukprot:TRINITY_DN5405_c0_g1_i5.p1 TRINITY_DN5405_c0_g1~~TRINITY_DN5405_c0_g1_i5.p1  ORF type:complete len:417 (-),score=130.95 TRINITY_DN5405_c0_g1_i5:30-1280(-)
MLFSTSLVAIVGAGDQPQLSPRRLQVLNTKTRQIICELNFVTAILKVLLNRKRMVVVMETKLHIYDISNMKILHTIDTSPNPRAICAFSPSTKNCFIAYPAGGTLPSAGAAGGAPGGPSGSGPASAGGSGDIFVFDALSLHTVNVIQAHKGAISAVAVSQDGTLLATASSKGTVIRVHTLPKASKSWTFRRGTYPAAILSLAFSVDSKFLCVASATGTVHIFKLDLGAAGGGSGSGSAGSTSSSGYGLVASYLPEVLSQVWEPARDFAHIKLPSPGVPVLCAITPTFSPSPAIEQLSSPSSTHPSASSSSSQSSSSSSSSSSSASSSASSSSSSSSLAPPSSSSSSSSSSSTLSPVPSHSAPSSSPSGLKVLILTGDGFYYQYPLDPAVGGELKLAKEFSLLMEAQDGQEVSAKYV